MNYNDRSLSSITRILYRRYMTLYRRLEKAIAQGRFSQYATEKQATLLARLHRYEYHLSRWGVVVASTAPLFFTPLVASAQPTPLGSEFRINTYTTRSQFFPSVATDSDGDFVVAWESRNQDGSYGIFGQRYNAAGTAQGSEFRINTYTNIQRDPSVAMDSDGDFVVTWHSLGQEGSGYGVYGQRYNTAGVAQGSEFRINTYTTGDQRSPSVAMDSDGNFVVTWASFGQDGNGYGIYGQRYDNTGMAQGGEFRINTYTTSSQSSPSVAMDSNGDFVVAWASNGQDGNGYGIYGQRYNATGMEQDSEFRISTYTTNNQFRPSAAMDSDGDFVVTWASFGQDGDGYGIYGQRYNAIGVAQNSEFQINTYDTSSQFSPSVAVDSDGAFVVTWQSSGQDVSGYGVYGQRYNAAGMVQGDEFRINTYTTSTQLSPSVAMDSDGDFVVTWASFGQDISDYGIYGQRYSSVLIPVELLYFKGILLKGRNLLVWSTASELNNEGFQVERSEDAKIWKFTGFVKGNGTTIEQQDYQFMDESPSTGINYYRLKQLDYNGAFEYSDIIALVTTSDSNTIAIYPNPVDQELIIENAVGIATLYNALGQVIRQIRISDSRYVLPTGGLSKGVYTLHLKPTNGALIVQQLVK